MNIQTYYYDPCIIPNAVIADTNEGLYLLCEKGIAPLTEMPPSADALSLNKKRRFIFRTSNANPQLEHLSELHSVYTSATDTIFFFETGAVIQLQHRNFSTQGLHYVSSTMIEPTPVFHSSTEAEKLGILEEDISASPFYTKVDCKAPAFAEPVEGAYIVYPGWLLKNEPSLFPKFCLKNDTMSVDFIMNTHKPKMHPLQFGQFWQIPSLFCALTQASFGHNIWDSHAGSDYLPEVKAYPFTLQGECIAEMICVDTFCEPGNFPYHDTFTLTLNYLKTYDAAVQSLIRQLLGQYDNILPVPPHLCGKEE